MIRIKGDLELRSADQIITFHGDDDQMILNFNSWPKSVGQSTSKFLKRFNQIDLAPIRVEYKNSYLATFHKMKISKINFITGVKALFGYIKTRF